ncbi:MAG: serine/threonine protein kinase [Hyphomicrobiales bacterium]|nr:serine/threonine protein kinase [Hyphomicrobiales bacterium]MBV8826086.1 serine/threonine protein kinase [Hyphomicrobiales bacterium]MBV9427784.1 serine/threonine protein kinase [Bradyrhizobiaceae bacterium]
MTEHTIRLPHGEWIYDDAKRLGQEGGFGDVFRGKGASGDVAIKRLKLTASQAAHRELSVAEHFATRKFVHVVPVLDAGQDAQTDRYFLVMPVCGRSLQDAINETRSGLEAKDAIPAIVAILRGLQEVADITHRDLKPANVLDHQGVWKIADFGIAKFVEDATSLETLRTSLTPSYAAPEQWLGERPTGATDIYALGCIIYALFTGKPPFGGSLDDLREQHLHGTPLRLDRLLPREAAFVTYMLRKLPPSRPSLPRCIQIFSSASVPALSPRIPSGLAKAARDIAEEEAIEEARVRAATTRRQWREALIPGALAQLNDLQANLFNAIGDVFESVRRDQYQVFLGRGYLRFEPKKPPSAIIDLDWIRGWGAICDSTIGVHQITGVGGDGYHVWEASLFYGGPSPEGECRWYEVAFKNPHYEREGAWTKDHQPVSGEGMTKRRDIAFRINERHDLAYGPVPIDAEDEDGFIHRWSALLAKAAAGRLRPASRLPIVIDSLVQ